MYPALIRIRQMDAHASITFIFLISSQKKRGYENIIHFWQHDKQYGYLIHTTKNFMRSKVNYLLIFSPLSFLLSVILTYAFYCVKKPPIFPDTGEVQQAPPAFLALQAHLPRNKPGSPRQILFSLSADIKALSVPMHFFCHLHNL